MTGDASRLLVWKGLGGTPATVTTLPPTVAERHKVKQMKRLGNQQLLECEAMCVCACVCQRTSLDRCSHGGVFYGSGL